MPPDDDESAPDCDEYPDLPVDQMRRLLCLDRALDRAEATQRPINAAQIVAEAQVFDAFIVGS